MATPTLSTLGTASSKEQALEYVNSRMTDDKVFTQIKKGDFIRALQANIRHPSRINQGNTNFCGPASILHALAKYHPIEYARFALDLFQKGHAIVRGAKVDAGYLKNEPVPEHMGIENVCDWVTMASLRFNLGCFSCLSALTTVTTKVQGTYPYEIKMAFEMMGYTDVRNCTSWFKADKENFGMASLLCQENFRVVLNVHDNMFKDPAEKSWLPRNANHFCTLKSTEEIGNRIKCRLWQWGITGGKKQEPTTLPVGIHVDLPKEQFLDHYFGYIAAGEYQAL
jgi:hypothetical protein